jgi:hypothetical protein
MKVWIMFVLFAVSLCCPALSGAIEDITDSGKGTMFNYPLMKIPIGDGSTASREKKDPGEAKYDEEKEKQIRDKKVEDAIKKAWEEK